jgi:DNA-directed RNA polymerase subunit RPC12/RpoP
VLENSQSSAFPFAVVGASQSAGCPKCGGKLVFEDKNTMSGEDIREYRCASCGESVVENRGPALWYIMQEANKKESVLHAPMAGKVLGNSAFKQNAVSLFIGIILAGAGVWVIYNFGYVPWDLATRGAPARTSDIRVLMIGPIALVVGLVLLISIGLSEPKAAPGNQAPKRDILARIIVLVAAAAIIAGIAAYFWLRSFLRDRGYFV